MIDNAPEPRVAPGDASSRAAEEDCRTASQRAGRRSWSRRRHLLVVAAVFGSSRLVFILGGHRFSMSAIWQDQLLDVHQLRAHPFLAFSANHIQPPLWNFFVGAVLRWSPLPSALSFQLIFLALGLVTVLSLWAVLEGLGARQWSATAATAVVALSPLMIMNENVLHYETPETTVLTVSALLFLRYVQAPGPRRLAGFAAVFVVGVLLRTTLQPLWLVGGLVVAGVCRPPKGWWRSALAVIAVVVLAVGIPLVHRAASFGTTGFSSFWGMNLKRITVMQLPEADVRRLMAQGKLSPIAPLTGPYAKFEPFLDRCRSHTGNPVLDDVEKSDGSINFNGLCMMPIYRLDAKDALASIRNEPRVYAGSVARASTLYVVWPTVGSTARILRDWDEVYAPLTLPTHVRMVLGGGDPQPAAAIFSPGQARVSVTMVVALAFALAVGVLGGLRVFRRRAQVRDELRFFIGFTVVSLTAVSITMDFFENARFRQPLDPLLLGPFFVFLLEGVTRVWRSVRRTSRVVASA